MITNSLNDLMSTNANDTLSFSLKGLLSGHVGMLIAAPNVGKSHLALCIAIEHASSAQLIGLSSTLIPKKTMVISAEDGADILRQRMADKLSNFQASIRSELEKNLSFMTDIDPIVVPPDSAKDLITENRKYQDELIKKLTGYDLAILDTVTEAIGNCEEVKHDRLIKNAVQRIAKESGCSLLLVHHVNKEEIRGTQQITMASGAGLTSIMRLTKCLFTLQHKKERTFIKFLKSNYLSMNDSQDIDIKIENALSINPDVFDLKAQPSSSKPKRSVAIPKDEPKSIKLSGDSVSESEVGERRSLRDVL